MRAARIAAWLIGGCLIWAGGAGAGQVDLVSRVHPDQISDTGAGAEPAPHPDSLPDFPSPPSWSADGRYVVFLSAANNLVPGQIDMNSTISSGRDVFLQDVVTGTTLLVSRAMSFPQTTGNQSSVAAVLSGDGRYVAFTSRATDLVPGQSGDPSLPFDLDVLLYDRITGALSQVASSRRTPASFGGLAMSFDGRYLAFSSDAKDLVPGQQTAPSEPSNVFLYDRVEKTTRLVSHTPASTAIAGNGRSRSPRLSGDGRYVLFSSDAQDLLPGQKPGDNLFLYDRVPGTVSPIGSADVAELSADGRFIALIDQGTAHLYDRGSGLKTSLGGSCVQDRRPLSLSADGRFVAFIRCDNGMTLILYDRVTGTFTPASRPRAVIEGPSLSADGQYLAFISRDSDLISGQTDTNESWDVFLFNRTRGTVSLVSGADSSSFRTGDSGSYSAAVCANGTRIAFYSAARDLVGELKDLNQGQDVFSSETASGMISLLSTRAPETPSLSPDSRSAAKALSADGRFVAFESDSAHLIPGQADSNRTTDVFLYDRTNTATILVSRSAGQAARTADGTSLLPEISADGRYIVFFSNAKDLAPGADDPRQGYDIFLFDRIAATTVLVGQTWVSSGPETASRFPTVQISADGRWVAFTSLASDVIPGQQDRDGFGTFDIFLWDRVTRNTVLVSRSSAGAAVTGSTDSSLPVLSANGRYVAFVSSANDLVPGQSEETVHPDIFLYDRVTGRTALVSHASSSALTAASSEGNPSISADGRFVLFRSSRGDLDPNVSNAGGGFYLYDRTLDTNQWITQATNLAQPALSAEGRYVVLTSDLPVIPGPRPVNQSIYLFDRVTRSFTKIGDAVPESLAISSDGRYIAFESRFLFPGQVAAPGRQGKDIFLFDRETGTTALASRSRTSPVTAMGFSENLLLSADGRRVAFTSLAALTKEDFNHHPDAFLFNAGGPVPLPPCTLFDTRRRPDRPALRSNVRKVLPVHGRCGVPADAAQVQVKVTVLQGSGKGNLRFFPGNDTTASSGILRFERGKTRTASFTLPLATNGNGTLALLPFVAGNGTVHVVVEVNGFLE